MTDGLSLPACARVFSCAESTNDEERPESTGSRRDRGPDRARRRRSTRSTTAGSASPRQRSCGRACARPDASFRIVKNTLTLRAADKAGRRALKALVEEGPTALTFVRGDPALAAKALDTFARQAQVLELKGGVLGGRLLDADEVRQLARLPGRDQLNAQLAGVVASPLTGLVRGLGSLLSGLAIALGQVREQKEAEAPAGRAAERRRRQPRAEAAERGRGGSPTATRPSRAEDAEQTRAADEQTEAEKEAE